MKFKPMQDFILATGIKTVIRGSKKADARVGVPDGFIQDGITYLSPIWDWSTNEVWNFLDAEGIYMPSDYDHTGDSLDCFSCTAFLLPHYDGQKKLNYIKNYYPDFWPALSARLRIVRDALIESFDYTKDALDIGDL